MRKLLFLKILIVLSLTCTTEKVLFEKDTWWLGHWQNTEDTSLFFSIGQKRVGANEIVTPQFFISTRDSIHTNFYLKNLMDFNHNKKWKVIETNDNRFIKIKELDELHIELSGPVNTKEKLDAKMVDYRILPDSIAPPIPDSILFGR